MYPAPFEYHLPGTVAEAVSLLGTFQDDAKVIAGSQSLIPMMKLRLVQPRHVIDLRKVPGLVGISESDGALVIGALTTHRAIEASEVVRSRIALTGLAPKVARAGRVEKALEGTLPSPASLKAAAEKAADGLELRADAIGSADYKAHLAAVYTERALRRAVARAVET